MDETGENGVPEGCSAVVASLQRAIDLFMNGEPSPTVLAAAQPALRLLYAGVVVKD